MAAIIKADFLGESGGEFNYNFEGTLVHAQVDRTWRVMGVDLSVTGNASLGWIVAGAAGVSPGDEHPVEAWKMLTARRVRLKTIPGVTTGMDCVITYQYDLWPLIQEIDSELTQVQEDTDKTGLHGILVKWYPDVETPGDNVTGDFKPGHGVVTVLRPQKTLITSRTIDYDTAMTVFGAIDTYEGHVNGSTWNGGAAYTWMCSKIALKYDQEQGVYNCTIVLIYNPKTWKPVSRYRDTTYGTPSNLWKGTSDSDPANNGYTQVDSYYTADFSVLLGLIT